MFITFTCNSKWPEIHRYADKLGLRPEDRPDIIARIFKIKLDQFVCDGKTYQICGRVKAIMYTIEFQKHGLPHAHILLFLHREDKHLTGPDIDKIIFAEIPDKETNSRLYGAVVNFMMHGPYGTANKSSPCMSNDKCTKHVPKKFVQDTTIGEDGYLLYRRSDNGKTAMKGNVPLDNKYVVSYNPILLLKYDAHINVEWCNQDKAIKYLFKYVNKGNDHIIATFYRQSDSSEMVDEVKMYYDCRYVSPCEAVWRIFGFPITHRELAVERLIFHLPNEQTIVFQDDDHIDNVVNRVGNDNTMFLQWMKANEKYLEARELTYVQFSQKIVWKEVQDINRSIEEKTKIHEWCPRQRGMSVGRMFYVHPGVGELYYLRFLLNFMKGPTNYDEIRTVNGIVHPTFRDVCFALGLLDDDKEYIDAIVEASLWDSGHYLRALFATMLLTTSMNKLEVVWDQTSHLLVDDILHRQ